MPLLTLVGRANVCVCRVGSVLLKLVRARIDTRLKYVYHMISCKGKDQKLNICGGSVNVKSEGVTMLRWAAGNELSFPTRYTTGLVILKFVTIDGI